MESKENLRRMIDGCLNRINLTKDQEEFYRLNNYLNYYINEYSKLNFERMEDFSNERD